MALAPAYPEAIGDTPGATLRDYFAAMAMQSIILSVGFDMHNVEVAHSAYEIADQMLVERMV